VGAALTLDEFALWLNVEEGVYWTRRDLAKGCCRIANFEFARDFDRKFSILGC